MYLNIEKSGEQDQECSQEWSVNTGPGFGTHGLYVRMEEQEFVHRPRILALLQICNDIVGQGYNACNILRLFSYSFMVFIQLNRH